MTERVQEHPGADRATGSAPTRWDGERPPPDRLAALVTRHCATIRRDADRIHGALNALSRPVCGKDWTALLGMLHTLHGSSGSLGFSDIAAAADTLEVRLRALGPEGTMVHGEDIADLADALQAKAAAMQPGMSALLPRRP